MLDCYFSKTVWLLADDGVPLNFLVAFDDANFWLKLMKYWKGAGMLELCLNIGWVLWLNRNKCKFDEVCLSYLASFT